MVGLVFDTVTSTDTSTLASILSNTKTNILASPMASREDGVCIPQSVAR